MHTLSDTICALATPPGVSGLAVVRVSGPDSFHLVDQFFRGSVRCSDARSHTIHVGWWEVQGKKLDNVAVSVFRNPHSYTGEDVVEISCHGGLFVVNHIVESLLSDSIRLAMPGEFTRRAFVNKKLDLTQAEAVADLIHAQSVAGVQTAARQLAGGFTRRLKQLRNELLHAIGLLEVELDFSEEGYEFVSRPEFEKVLQKGITMASELRDSARSAHMLRSGFYCAIVGYPNAGKSSLFNALLMRDRAIVSDIAGTTRDFLDEAITLNGCVVHLVDTAGIRETDDIIETMGIVLATRVVEQSNLVLVINDASFGPLHSNNVVTDLQQRFPQTTVVTVQNKIDLLTEDQRSQMAGLNGTHILTSATTSDGVSALRSFIESQVEQNASAITDVLINDRQSALLGKLLEYLQAAHFGIANSTPPDIIAIDLRGAISVLGDITGETWNPDVLDMVFSRFCIGK